MYLKLHGKLNILKTKSDMKDSNSNTYTMTFLLEDNKVKLINLAFYPFGYEYK